MYTKSTYLEYPSVCPPVGIGTPPHPHSRNRVYPPPELKGGDTLCLLCACTEDGEENIYSNKLSYIELKR